MKPAPRWALPSVRPLVDHELDRRQVQAPRGAQPSRTNRPSPRAPQKAGPGDRKPVSNDPSRTLCGPQGARAGIPHITVSRAGRRPGRRGSTRTHPEPGSQARQRRRYCGRRAAGEQGAAAPRAAPELTGPPRGPCRVSGAGRPRGAFSYEVALAPFTCIRFLNQSVKSLGERRSTNSWNSRASASS